jgi:glycosyltransferase involved in cell wall biosynthesis
MTVPHVVMLVANDATTDARVRKSALALAATGARVSLVAYAPDGVRSEAALGDVSITRVPVQFTLRDAVRERARRRRTAGLPLLRPVTPERDLVLRRTLAARERDLANGGARWPVELHRQAARARRYAGRLGVAGARKAWGGIDRARSRTPIGARWRAVLPEVDDYELAFGPVVDALAPDLIYAHDVQLLPVAARAVARGRAQGRHIPWVYDAHEWVPGLSRYGSRTARVVAAWADLEAEYIRDADAVVTVSDDLADALMRRHRLPERPAVVLNIPPVVGGAGPEGGIRAAVRLAPDVPLAVYSGGVTEARGVQTAVAALKDLAEVHLAVVAVPSAASAAAQAIVRRAVEIGVADRVHLLDPVAPQDVTAYLRSADVGLIPLRHFGSHEFALTNKLFEYLHAGLPMVVSDCRAQADFVRRYGLGAVHVADDPRSLAGAVRTVLAAGRDARVAVESSPVRLEMTWPVQVQRLQAVVERLTAGRVGVPQLDPDAGLEPGPETPRTHDPRAPWLGLGPTNSAGQASAWASAVRRTIPDVRTEVVAITNDRYDYPADIRVTKATYARDATWGLDLLEHARGHWTHALIEAARPMFGAASGADASADIEALRAAGVQVGLVFHGSEVRDPRIHASTHPYSPFGDPRDPYTARLQQVADRTLALARSFDGPVFVSTPDQLDHLPAATWLPVVVDLERWPLRTHQASGPPLVVHAPSNPALKGTHYIEAAIAPLVESGAVRYQRVTDLQPDDAAALVASADIVIDQVLLGLYGVLACEALASGAVVVGHVGDSLRARVPEPVPIIEATPDDLRERIEDVLDRFGQLRSEAEVRRGFVERIHSGRRSAQALAPFLGVSVTDA